MKKISLKNLNLQEVEQLSREQLKNVLGGYTGVTDSTDDTPTTRDSPCYVAEPGESTTSCKVKLNGEWKQLNVVPGNGMDCGQYYVSQGWATNYCCDSCP